MVKYILGAVALAAAQLVSAAPSVETIQKAIPEFGMVTSVKATPISGLYEVIGASSVIYVNDTATHFISGHMFDIATKKSLTASLLQEFQDKEVAKQVAEIDKIKDTLASTLIAKKANFLVEVKGNGATPLYMVTDIRCGYCKKMEATLAELTDVTIYRIPVAYLGQESLTQGNAAWCAKDRLTAWKDLTAGKSKIAKAADCITPLVENTQLSKDWKVTGTPTLFKADGDRWSRGYMNAEDTRYFLKNGSSALIGKLNGDNKAVKTK